MDINIQVNGNFSEIYAKLEKLRNNINNIQLTKEMLEILETSKSLVPVRTGFLRSSAFISHAKNSWKIGYTADYATYVHELHRTKSKFLESPFLNKKHRLYESIIKQLKK